jgi:flagellar motor switch protein FliN/FliY
MSDAAQSNEAKGAAFEELKDDNTKMPALPEELEVLLDIPVTISLEVGKSTMSIRKLMQLNQGAVVELDKQAGEPLDVMVNGTLIAHAEVVVINNKFGLRLTDVISPTERIEKIKE